MSESGRGEEGEGGSEGGRGEEEKAAAGVRRVGVGREGVRRSEKGEEGDRESENRRGGEVRGRRAAVRARG